MVYGYGVMGLLEDPVRVLTQGQVRFRASEFSGFRAGLIGHGTNRLSGNTLGSTASA